MAFFISVCSIGFQAACSEFAFPAEIGRSAIERVQNLVGLQLFTYDKARLIGDLTAAGMSFLPRAKRIINELIESSITDDKHSDIDSGVVIRSNPLEGKFLLLPNIVKLKMAQKYSHIHIELFTHEEEGEDVDIMSSHILFKNMGIRDRLFFEKRWAIKVDQGLYASEGYLYDVGIFPQTPADLQKHSILGYGDSFNPEIYESLNWHLSQEYGLLNLEPSIMVSSRAVLMNAVEFDLGVGPIADYRSEMSSKKLHRVLPQIKGPPMIIEFAVRKFLTDRLRPCIEDITNMLLNSIRELNLELIY
ncbi:MAG: hypothetical protein LBF56_00580 [Holosporales bacterium]|nr:hypothetical protein [Holosporales bacterium]